MEAETVRKLRAPLVRWYRRNLRDLPWRRTRDPYAIWVSEVMLQQTTVAAVVPYWQRFLDRFPDVRSLARAREEEVLALWTGLGYYRRARALRQGAIAVMERHGGRVPADTTALIDLPGIGRYTAGAIASVAFGHETPVVDGNVTRVLARWTAIKERGAALDERAWSIAEVLVRGRDPGDLNQALMELGATVCTPRAPACERCPVAKHCAGRASGAPESFPAPRQRKPVRSIGAAVAWIEDAGRILVAKRREGGLLRGSWDLPAVAMARDETAAEALERHLRRYRLRVRRGRTVAKITHTILQTRLEIEIVALSAASHERGDEHRWVRTSALSTIATSGATLKAARAVAAQNRSHASRSASSSSSSGSGSRARVNA